MNWNDILALLQGKKDLGDLFGRSTGASFQSQRAINELDRGMVQPQEVTPMMRSAGFYNTPDPNRTIDDGTGTGNKITQKDYQALERAIRARDAAMRLGR